MTQGPAPQRDEQQVSAWIERFASTLMASGFPRMPARVFVALESSDSGRMTAAELAERLQISPAAVSGAVRYLAGINMIRREREPGSRRDYYYLPDNVWQEVITRRDQLLARWQEDLREGMRAVGPDTPAGRRIADTLDFYVFMGEEVPNIVKRWQERRAARTRNAPHPDPTPPPHTTPTPPAKAG
ncbi:GbsR/MarR family transcriptional regulator [Allostreptomyces psammosilenae]|uniref:Putative transcriptional regulator n=1 Tax=Allostreptomyces psammosilenae TaxID=1892865 RepID=A0A853A0E9_9ACTN|nr:MarR family transcriptional regulator [Allostreptomyces psammosilenae]NYI07859.1 putative transcriptional regulator [Allostreptomyces psammosilenae]